MRCKERPALPSRARTIAVAESSSQRRTLCQQCANDLCLDYSHFQTHAPAYSLPLPRNDFSPCKHDDTSGSSTDVSLLCSVR